MTFDPSNLPPDCDNCICDDEDEILDPFAEEIPIRDTDSQILYDDLDHIGARLPLTTPRRSPSPMRSSEEDPLDVPPEESILKPGCLAYKQQVQTKRASVHGPKSKYGASMGHDVNDDSDVDSEEGSTGGAGRKPPTGSSIGSCPPKCQETFSAGPDIDRPCIDGFNVSDTRSAFGKSRFGG